MALNFPNQMRSFEPTRSRVKFWGYDGTFEVCFFVEQSAIAKLNPAAGRSEPEFLRTFDRFRERILAAAMAAYSRAGSSSSRGSGTYSLLAANF